MVDAHSRINVLCVDDEPINLRVAADLLSIRGANVVCAGSGAAALEILAQAAFDVVLLDIHMPQLDGIDTLQAIRRLGPPNGDIPAVAVTADQSMSRRDYLALGFDEFVPKPVSLASIFGAVTAVLDLRRDRRLAGLRRPG